MTRAINTFDDAAVRLIAQQVLRMKQQSAGPGVRDSRGYPGGPGGRADKRGKPTLTIDAGTDGTVELYDSTGATGRTVAVHNPHNVALVPEEFVRVWKSSGFAKPLVSPDHYTACDELVPIYTPETP